MQPDTGAARRQISVWIVEDHRDYREKVRSRLEQSPDFASVQAFESAEELLAYLNDHFAPDVVLVDLMLPNASGVEVISRLRNSTRRTQTLVLTNHEDNDLIFGAICAGASGYLLKTATGDEILQAVRDVHAGGAPMTKVIARRVLDLFAQRAAPQWDYNLTERETDVLERIVEGKSKAEIAKELYLSIHTVDTHFRGIYSKLHVNSRSSAVSKALKERLVRG